MGLLLDVGIIIGVFLALMKGVELVLLPRQQKQVQDFFEQLTIWLDDVSDEKIPDRLTDPAIQALLCVFGAATWMFAMLSLFLLPLVWSRGAILEDDSPSLRLYAVGFLLAYIVLASLWTYPVRPIVNWAIGSGDSAKIRKRGRTIIAAAWSLAILTSVILVAFVHRFGSPHDDWRLAIDVIVGTTLNAFFIAGYCIAMAAAIASDLAGNRRSSLARLFLTVTKGFLWRIVEYQKGVIAALVLVATIGLSVIKIYT